MHPRIEPTGFGIAVADSASLDASAAMFNAEIASRGEVLFIRVAEAANRKDLRFAGAAGDNNLDCALERHWLGLADMADLEYTPADGDVRRHMSLAKAISMGLKSGP